MSASKENKKLQHPLEKNSASFYPKYRTQTSKSNKKLNQKKYQYHQPRKTSDFSDGSSEDDYSGLKFNNPKNDFRAKYKTEICHYWEMYGTCKYGDSCAFAHGAEELNKRKLSYNYKTKPCKQFFEIGYCTYGIRCQFSHKKPQEEIDEKDKISYLKILEEFNNSNKLISHEVIKRPRLMTFEDIIKCDNNMTEKNRLELYKDIINIKENNERDNTNNNNNDNIDKKKRARFISI